MTVEGRRGGRSALLLRAVVEIRRLGGRVRTVLVCRQTQRAAILSLDRLAETLPRSIASP